MLPKYVPLPSTFTEKELDAIQARRRRRARCACRAGANARARAPQDAQAAARAKQARSRKVADFEALVSQGIVDRLFSDLPKADRAQHASMVRAWHCGAAVASAARARLMARRPLTRG